MAGPTSGSKGTARVGCSGYDYRDWRGRFYPEDLAHRRWLEWYGEHFGTVELNAPFYRLPEVATFEAWAGRVPPGFAFAVKLSRFGSHRKRLMDPETWLGTFVERVEHLGPTLGPVLVQLPPRWRADPGRLDAFLEAAPTTLHWAVEVRDRRWLCDEVYEVLAAHDAALVWHDLLAEHPHVVTSGWIYVRMHGADAPDRPYHGTYGEERLRRLADELSDHLAGGRDVWVYFNNDVGAAAPGDAACLRALLGAGADG